jgi:enamine deaminase RidA (YjgF/YER057c/UK114 family)/chorismate mutase
MTMSLDDIRREIDQLDDQIVALLARRQQQVTLAAGYMFSPAATVAAAERPAELMRRVRARASTSEVDAEVVTQVYTAMIDAFTALEHRANTETSSVSDASAVQRQQVSSGSPYEPTIGFSRALRTGNRVLVSGTGPVWSDGSCPDDAGAQARRCFEIIGDALAEVGAGWSDVLRTRMFITDQAAADQVSAVHGELFGEVRPAATMVIVAGLLDPRWKVEIEAEAEVSR